MNCVNWAAYLFCPVLNVCFAISEIMDLYTFARWSTPPSLRVISQFSTTPTPVFLPGCGLLTHILLAFFTFNTIMLRRHHSRR